MLNKEYILYIFVFWVGLTSYSQDNYTNIDTTLLEVRWQTNYLNALQFQNGDNITVCTDNNTWRYQNNRNKAAVYMIPNNPNLYNYYALIDERNICPRYFRVPTELDYNGINIKTSTTANYKETGSSNFLNVHPLEWIDYSSGQVDFRNQKLIFPITLGTNSDRSQGEFDTPSEYYFNTVSIDEKGTFSIWREPKNGTGLPVKCITDINAIIKDSVFDYKQLIWQKYTTTLQEILSSSLAYFGQKESFTIQLNASMQSNRNNTQVFRLSVSEFNVLGNSKNISKLTIEERLMDALRSKIPLPTYKGTVLLAQSKMELTLKREILKMPDQRFLTSNVKQASVTLSDPKINYAHDHGFRVKTYKEVTSIADGTETIYSKVDLKVASFHGRGSVYSFAAVIPGLGLKTVNRIQYKATGTASWEKLSKTFLVSSISLGAIGVASKIFSEIYYNKYKENTFGLTARQNYNLANTSNKIFISSLLGYGLLSVLDFSFTFAVGIKNKSTQVKLNQFLKNDESFNLRADFEKEQITPSISAQEITKQSDTEINQGSFTDKRDGKVYKTVQVGSQVWMAENLAFKPKKGNFWAYDNNEINVKRYGYLYDWKTACKVCPIGWRLPSEDDWNTLNLFYGGAENAGLSLKSEKDWSKTLYPEGKSDFAALPSGFYNLEKKFHSIGYYGVWWSDTSSERFTAKAFLLIYNQNGSELTSYKFDYGFAVRCIKK